MLARGETVLFKLWSEFQGYESLFCYILTMILGWLESPFSIFHEIKDTLFIFTSDYWFGYFECVGCLPHGVMTIVLNYCLCSKAANCNWSTRPWSILQQEISNTELRRPLWTHSVSHSTFSIHYTNWGFFVFQLHFYLSWNIKAQYAENVAYFLPSSILKWLHKCSLILINFFKYTLIRQLSQYNLTNLFQMKLKTSKC